MQALIASNQTTIVCPTAADVANTIACLVVPPIATMYAAIRALACPGSNAWSAPKTMAMGRQTQAWAALTSMMGCKIGHGSLYNSEKRCSYTLLNLSA
jgi:hypothetical protein